MKENSNKKLNIEDMKILNDIFNEYQGLLKYRFCVLNNFDGKCSDKIIKAHSISKSQTLNNISDNLKNKNIVGYFSKTNPLDFNPYYHRIREKYIDIKSASTFTGLCQYHDNLFFQNIDKNEFDPDNPNLVFEYTLRNCIYQYYDRISNIKGYRKSMEYINENLNTDNFTDISYLPFNTMINDKKILKNDLDILKDNIYSYNKKDILLYKILTYKGNLNISGNLKLVFGKEAFYITFIPEIKNSYILISAIRGKNILEKNFLFSILKSNNKEQTELFLSDCLLQATSIKHFFFNYNKFSKLNSNDKNKIYRWLDVENYDKINTSYFKYKLLRDIPNFIKLMLS